MGQPITPIKGMSGPCMAINRNRGLVLGFTGSKWYSYKSTKIGWEDPRYICGPAVPYEVVERYEKV